MIALGYVILSCVTGLVQANVRAADGSSDYLSHGFLWAIFWPLLLLTWPGRHVRRRRILQERAERERARVLGSTVEQLVREQ